MFVISDLQSSPPMVVAVEIDSTFDRPDARLYDNHHHSRNVDDHRSSYRNVTGVRKISTHLPIPMNHKPMIDRCSIYHHNVMHLETHDSVVSSLDHTLFNRSS